MHVKLSYEFLSADFLPVFVSSWGLVVLGLGFFWGESLHAMPVIKTSYQEAVWKHEKDAWRCLVCFF